MNKYVPVATVLVAMLLLWNSMPQYVMYFLVFILIMLVLNKWDELSTYFK